MAILLEQQLPGVLNNGLNTNKATALGSTLDVTGAVTMASTLAVTGAITATGGISGTLTTTGGLIGGVQTLAAAGAVNLTTLVTRIDSAGAIALTLADGTNGQVKIIVMGTDGGDATLTPTTKTGYSTITFNDAGDGVTLVFITTKGWIVAGNNGATLA